MLKSADAAADMDCDACGRFAILAMPFSARSSRPRQRLRRPARPDSCADSSWAQRGADAHVLADAGLRVETRSRRVLLRVRARDESLIRRELGLLVERRGRSGVGQVLPRGNDQRSCSRRPEVGQRKPGPADQDKDRADPDPGDSVNLVLPWFTGKPYALYAHVRAVTTRGATAWSKPFGFNMRWESTPVPLVSKPGLVRWAPVEGATAYDVWYPDIRKVIRTHTNVADQRELYSFHLEDSWWQLVRGASARCGRSSAPSRTACPQSPTGHGARRTRRQIRRGPPGSCSSARPCPTPSAPTRRRPHTSSCPG